MAEQTEKHYSIDAGEGFKMEGCPYSLYADGHDVVSYIIAPKGYRFVGFKLVDLPNNQIYDGKLLAQYEKESLANLLSANLWKIILAVAIIAIITLIVALASGISHDHKPAAIQPAAPQTIVPVIDIDTIIADTNVLITDTISDSIQNDSTGVILDLSDRIVVSEESSQPVDPNASFKQEFWALIHCRTLQMDLYDALYKSYKHDASGEEFEYLRLTILKDWVTYKEWYNKLKKIPSDELQSIETIHQLIEKLDAIE